MRNLFLFIGIAIMGLASCKKVNPELGDPPTQADAQFTYTESIQSPNIIIFTLANPEMRAIWDFGNGTKAEGTTVSGVYPNAGTYTVKVTVFNKGGSATSTQDILIAQSDPTLLDNPLYDKLTGGVNGPGSKTWVIDSTASGHLGVGPDPISAAGAFPEWYATSPLEKSGTGLYDDKYTFSINGFVFNMEVDNEVYVHNTLSGNYPGSYQNLGDYTAPYTDQMNESWSLIEGANDTTFTLSGNSFIGMYTGVQTYRILEISDTSLWLQYKHHAGGLNWYLKLIPEGFVPSGGGGGGPVGTTTLPLDFETQQPIFDLFGGTAYSYIANPNSGGNNTSATVMEVIHGNQTWAGMYTSMATAFDFSTATTIQLKVWAPVAGAFRIKVENSANTNDFVELDATITAPNTWETISVDFSGTPSGVYDRLVLFPGWNISSSDTFYIDDIEQL